MTTCVNTVPYPYKTISWIAFWGLLKKQRPIAGAASLICVVV